MNSIRFPLAVISTMLVFLMLAAHNFQTTELILFVLFLVAGIIGIYGRDRLNKSYIICYLILVVLYLAILRSSVEVSFFLLTLYLVTQFINIYNLVIEFLTPS